MKNEIAEGAVIAGRYALEDALGAGAFGEVWRARDTRLGRQVAIKFMRPEVAKSDSLRRRFEREARVLATIQHPHVVQVFDDGEWEGSPYLVLEFVRGQTLRELLEATWGRGQMLAPATVRVLMDQVAAGVAAAHRASVVHRDLKPENILLQASNDGSGAGLQAKVLDFGLARGSEGNASSAVMTVGTYAYMSPEQASDGADGLTMASDVFALGIILVELLTGQTLPERGKKTPWERVALAGRASGCLRVLIGARSDVSASVWSVAERALSAEPAARFADAGELRRALEAAWDGGAAASAGPADRQRAAFLQAPPHAPSIHPAAVASNPPPASVALFESMVASQSTQAPVVHRPIVPSGSPYAATAIMAQSASPSAAPPPMAHAASPTAAHPTAPVIHGAIPNPASAYAAAHYGSGAAATPARRSALPYAGAVALLFIAGGGLAVWKLRHSNGSNASSSADTSAPAQSPTTSLTLPPPPLPPSIPMWPSPTAQPSAAPTAGALAEFSGISGVRCVATPVDTFRLRSSATFSPDGPEYSAGTRVGVIQAETLIRRGVAMFRAATPDGRVGFTFLPASTLDPSCPHDLLEAARKAACLGPCASSYVTLMERCQDGCGGIEESYRLCVSQCGIPWNDRLLPMGADSAVSVR